MEKRMIKPEEIAEICHEVNRAYCEAIGETIGQRPWNEAPEWQIKSAINGVKTHMNNPLLSPKESHEAWKKEKLEDGWSYGPVKDEEKKQHPCLVDYTDLPMVQRAKDYIFKAVCNQFYLTLRDLLSSDDFQVRDIPESVEEEKKEDPQPSKTGE